MTAREKCAWCAVNDASTDFFTLPDMGRLSAQAIESLSDVYRGQPLCRYCSKAFIRGFTMGEEQQKA